MIVPGSPSELASTTVPPLAEPGLAEQKLTCPEKNPQDQDASAEPVEEVQEVVARAVGLRRELGDRLPAGVVERADAEDGAIRAALEPVEGIRQLDHDVKCLRARVDHGATAVPLVLQALEAKGLAVDSVSVSRPSLDDVYMRYTGREFARADEEGTRKQQPAKEEKR